MHSNVHIFVLSFINLFDFNDDRDPAEWCQCFDTRVLHVVTETCNVTGQISLLRLTITLRWTVTRHHNSLSMTSYDLINVIHDVIKRLVIQQLTITSHWTRKHKRNRIHMTSYGL